MEELIEKLYRQFWKMREASSILIIKKEDVPMIIKEDLDFIVLAIVQDSHNRTQTYQPNYYNINEQTVFVQMYEKVLFERELLNEKQMDLMELVIHGHIELDEERYLTELKKKLESFPVGERRKKIAVHFMKLVDYVNAGKWLYRNERYSEAYQKLLNGLYHLACCSLIYYGNYPRLSIWEQVREIEPFTYKLYQDVIESGETLNKKNELLILIMDYVIYRKGKAQDDYSFSVQFYYNQNG